MLILSVKYNDVQYLILVLILSISVNIKYWNRGDSDVAECTELVEIVADSSCSTQLVEDIVDGS